MKTLLQKIFVLLIAVICTAEVMAQVPQGFNFQAVARSADGEVLKDTPLGVKISILKGTEEGTSVYSETQTPTTNAAGMLQLVIGEGTSEDDFSAIDWPSDNYFVKLEIDPAGGTDYEPLGTTRLLSVPYALLAHNVVNGTSAGEDVITEYNLNSSEGDTSFIVNATGETGFAAIVGNANTNGTNRGVYGDAISDAANPNTMYGVTGSASGTGTGNQLAVFGSAVNEDGTGGRRYGLYGQASSKGRENIGSFGIGIGPGDGEIVPIGEEVDGNIGGFNVGSIGFAQGNLNGNIGVRGRVYGTAGARMNQGVQGFAESAAEGLNVGVEGWALNSQFANFAFQGFANSNSSVNKGLVLHVSNGSDENVGIEVSSSDIAANLHGSVNIYDDLYVDGNITHTGSITQTSDRSLKEEIETLEDAMATIMHLNPTTYKFKGNGKYNGLNLSTGQHYGLIAQEVEEVLPSLVKTNTHTYNENGVTKSMDYKSMNYTELIPFLIKAIQEQQQEIDGLKAELEKLKK